MEYEITTDDNQLLTIDTKKQTVTYYCKSKKDRETKTNYVKNVLEENVPFPSIVSDESLFVMLEYVYIKKFEVHFK